jgi:hypothetical protein
LKTLQLDSLLEKHFRFNPRMSKKIPPAFEQPNKQLAKLQDRPASKLSLLGTQIIYVDYKVLKKQTE